MVAVNGLRVPRRWLALAEDHAQHSIKRCVCDDQYTATLESLQETNDENFKNYMSRKTQGWFRRWGCAGISDAAASATPGAAPPRRPQRRLPRRWRRGGRSCGDDTSA